MAAGGFNVSSPDLVRRVNKLARLDIAAVVRTTATTTAKAFVPAFKTAARAAGATPGLVRDVRVTKDQTNELVMRQRGYPGDILLGVDGASPHAGEAEELEWGGPDTSPTGWVRAAAGRNRRAIVGRWSTELTTELNKRVR